MFLEKLFVSFMPIRSNTYFSPAENECTAQQKATCDGGNPRTSCAVLNGDVYCTCPSGFALNATKYCIGKITSLQYTNLCPFAYLFVLMSLLKFLTAFQFIDF